MRKITLAALVLGAAAAAGCGHKRAGKAPARPVRVELVEGAAAATGLRYSASIQPYEQVSLAFKVGGYVSETAQRPGPDGRPRPLQQGDRVAKGSVLARVQTADYQEKVNQANAQVAEAQAGLENAKADAARAEALYAAKALTRPEYDSAVASLKSALAHAEGARAQHEAASISLREASLVAPADAVVLSRQIETGVLAGAGTVGFVLADLTRVKAVFGVPDSVVERLRIGTELPVKSEAFGEAFPGRVTAVSPSADPESRVFSVEVTIPNADGRLKAGMIASVELEPADAPDIPQGASSVSVSAVVKSTKPGGFAVFVVGGTGETGAARVREVSLGRIAGNRVAVETGLRQGERVVVSGASLLTDGDAVRVIPGEAR
jgi:multidrug efflux system membrane fusion protein